MTSNDHEFLNEVSVNIPREYFINSLLNISEIQLKRNKQVIDFAKLFTGNIYSIDFKNDKMDTNTKWVIQNTCDHKFRITISNEDLLITYTPYLYITPMVVLNLHFIEDSFLWGVQTHSEEYLFVQNLISKDIAFFKQITDKKIKLLALVRVDMYITKPIDSMSIYNSILNISSDGNIYIFNVDVLYQLIEFQTIQISKPIGTVNFNNTQIFLQDKYFVSGTLIIKLNHRQ